MDPVTIGILGTTVASGLAQWQGSQQAAKASAEERQRIAALYDKIQQPNFDPSSITPEEYSVVQKYVPQAAPYVQELNPTIIKDTAAMQQGKAAQLEALNRLRNIGSQDRDTALDAQLNEASRRAQIDANSRQQSILQAQARRGMLGSGNMLAAQLQGSSDAMDREAQAGNQAAIAAYQNRLNALRQGAALGGDISNQEMNMQARNADIINSFNQRTSKNYQNYLQDQAAMQNAGNQYNIQQAQQIANQNVAGRNQAALQNLNRRNELAQQNYSNQLGMANSQAGVGRMNIEGIQQAARDRNAAIQGLSSGITSGAMYYGQDQRANRAEDRADARAKMGLAANTNQPAKAPGTPVLSAPKYNNQGQTLTAYEDDTDYGGYG